MNSNIEQKMRVQSISEVKVGDNVLTVSPLDESQDRHYEIARRRQHQRNIAISRERRRVRVADLRY